MLFLYNSMLHLLGLTRAARGGRKYKITKKEFGFTRGAFVVMSSSVCVTKGDAIY